MKKRKKNDLYWYWEGVKMIGGRKRVIEEVLVDMGEKVKKECVMEVMVREEEGFWEEKKK